MEKRIVVLDTQVFLSLQLNFKHPQFRRLIDLRKYYDFQLVIPKLVELEVRKKLKESVTDLFNHVSKNKITSEYLGINSTPNLSDAIERANLAFEHFIFEYEVHLADHSGVECNKLVNLYVHQKPPFSSAKKSEFPDAIALLSIDDTPAQSKDIISGDSDWESYYSDNENVTTYKSLSRYIDEKLQESTDLIEELKAKLLSPINKPYIIEKLKEEISLEPAFAVYVNHMIHELNSDDCLNFRIKEINVMDIKEESYETKGGNVYHRGTRCYLDFLIEFDVNLDLGRVKQIINGIEVEVPKLIPITLETNASSWASLDKRSITRFSFGSFYPLEWHLQI